MLALVIKFIVDNPWRSMTLLCLIIIAALCLTIRLQWIAVQHAEIERDKAKLVVTQYEVEGKVQAEKIANANTELADLRRKQAKDKKTIADILAKWPTECIESVESAVKVLKVRAGQ